VIEHGRAISWSQEGFDMSDIGRNIVFLMGKCVPSRTVLVLAKSVQFNRRGADAAVEGGQDGSSQTGSNQNRGEVPPTHACVQCREESSVCGERREGHTPSHSAAQSGVGVRGPPRAIKHTSRAWSPSLSVAT
jgi:hypothetical protein